MPTTSNRSYASPAHGGAVNSWDTDVNAIFNQIDQNFGAVANVALSSVPVTLNSSQYVCGTIVFSGALTSNVVVTWPTVNGWWTVANFTTGAFVVQLTCGGGNRICAPPGELVDIQTGTGSMAYRNLSRVGSYLDLAASAVPQWILNCTVPPYLLCDGSSFSAVSYPALAAFLGGTTLPDTRGRLRANLDGSTGRITSAGGGVDGSTLFAAGGAQSRIVAQVNLPNYVLPNTLGIANNLLANFDYNSVNSIPIGGSNSAMGPLTGTQKAVNLGGSLSITGSITLGGSGTPLQALPPIYMGGTTLIRAA